MTPRRDAGPGKCRSVVRALPDRAKRWHFDIAKSEPDVMAAWRGEARWLVDGRALPPSSPAFLLDCLLHLDGIATVADLRAAWSALDEAHRIGEGPVFVEWTDSDGRLQRRQLSAISVLSLSAQASRPGFEATVGQLIRAWPQPPGQDRASEEERFALAVERVQAALVLMISGDLAGHVLGRQPLTALSRACLVRRATGRPLAGAHARPPEESLFDDDGLEPAIDGVELGLLDAAVRDGDTGLPAALVDKIIEACQIRAPDGQTSAGRRRAMLQRLRDLAPACEAAGSWVALFLLFAMQLVRFGTRNTRPLAPRTIPEYLGHCLRQLASRLAEVPMASASTLAWASAIYIPALEDPGVPDGQRHKLGAAFTAFHDLLCSVLGAAPLDKHLSPETTGPLAVANLVWQHEVRLALGWLADVAGDDRLLCQARAVLALLAAGAFRSEDAFHVHMAGVRRDGEILRIAVDPLPSAGDGKTAAARRHVEISDEATVQALKDWRDRRLDEGAMPRDLLFGDPLDGRLAYRRGATVGVINALLKAASGDETVGTHELRHAFLSLQRESLGVLDQRKLDSASAAAGHEWTSTTLTAYCHLYEAPLRRQMDRAIDQVRITERAACQLTKQKPGALRKRWQRGQADPAECIRDALTAGVSTVSCQDAEQWHPTQAPVNPLKPTNAPLRFGTVLDVLRDLAADRTVASVALRHGLSSSLVDALAQTAQSWTGPGRCRREPGRVTGIAIPWRGQWDRASQAKWATLRRRLDATRAETIQPVVASWAAAARDQRIDLDALALAHPLLHWLASAGITGEQMVVCHEGSTSPEPAKQLITALTGTPPIVRRTSPRRGRAKTYLMLTSRPAPPSGEMPNAATCIVGLHVLMFAAWVWSRQP